jgi:hypothetical protein
MIAAACAAAWLERPPARSGGGRSTLARWDRRGLIELRERRFEDLAARHVRVT